MLEPEIPKIKARTTEWAALATLIDGEGCLTCSSPTRKSRPRPKLQICQKFPILLLWAAGVFGGRVSWSDSQDRWTWRIGGGHLIAVLEGALPYMQLKYLEARTSLLMLRCPYGVDTAPLAANLKFLKQCDTRGPFIVVDEARGHAHRSDPEEDFNPGVSTEMWGALERSSVVHNRLVGG